MKNGHAQWSMTPIGDLFEVQLGKMVSEKSRAGKCPVPYLANYNVQWGRCDLSEVQTMDFDEDEVARFLLEPGDILVCEGGEVGRTAIWYGEIARCCYQKAIHRLRPKDGRIDRQYFLQFMSHATRENWFRRYTTSSSIAHLTRETLVEVEVPEPPLSEQKRIAGLLSAVDRAIESNRAVQTQTRRLKQATIQSLLTHGLPGTKSKLTTYRLGELYTERREPGIGGLPTVSVTIDSGLVDRDEMERRVESELTPEQHLRVHVGDLAYNTMRMWQGCSGVAGIDCLVSPAYVVCAPTDLIDPLFGGYLLRWENTIHKLHMQSQGVADDRLRLYFEQFARIKVSVPPVADQRRIASCLSAIDTLLSATTAAFAAMTKLKAALSQELLTGGTTCRAR